MRTGRPMPPLTLTSVEREVLEPWVGSAIVCVQFVGGRVVKAKFYPY